MRNVKIINEEEYYRNFGNYNYIVMLTAVREDHKYMIKVFGNKQFYYEKQVYHTSRINMTLQSVVKCFNWIYMQENHEYKPKVLLFCDNYNFTKYLHIRHKKLLGKQADQAKPILDVIVDSFRIELASNKVMNNNIAFDRMRHGVEPITYSYVRPTVDNPDGFYF